MPSPYLIGIGGPSGAGKTEVARALCARFRGTLISLDHYYHDLGHLTSEERSLWNFDHPDSLEWEMAETHLATLARGVAIDQPVYHFPAHTRGTECAHIVPGPLVILEGIFALYNFRIRSLLHTKVFVDLDDAECYRRRLERDMRERGRSAESVRRQYEETVRPMAMQFVRPTRRFADVVLAGDVPIEDSVRHICDHIRHSGVDPVSWRKPPSCSDPL